jgi:beta-glucosidase
MRLWLPATTATAILAAGLLAPSAPQAAAPAKQFSSHDGRIEPILAKMTLSEKVGQMTQPDQSFVKDIADVLTYSFGSVLSGGDSDPKTNRFEDWRDLYDRFQSQAAKTRLKIPLLYGVDAVHGHNNVIGAVVFPHNVGLGATRDAKLVEEIARITAKEVRATGINWAFSPCVTVPQDERWGRTNEGFSEDPKLVAELGAATVRGLQGADLKDPLRVLGCAKHYVGDGGTTWGTGTAKWEVPGKPFGLDQGDTRLSEAELRRIHMLGYPTAIEAGVGTIMPSYNSWNGEKCSGSKRLLTEILKGELGFEGFLISDYNALDQLPGDFRSDIKTSINAGMDMVMVPEKYKEFHGLLVDLAEKGEVPLARIDDAVKRILRVKAAMGLLDEGRSSLADLGLEKSFGSPEHREVARRAVRESLVLLKNDKKALPLAKAAARIHVAGKNADDLGNQMGGWSITWQGKSGATSTGTTILTAIKNTASKTTNVTFSKDGSGAAGATVGVVVVGELPYSEMRGDREDLGLDKEDKEAIANVKKAGVPVVVVLLSGRPMIIADVLPKADAFVAAWLPGTEGQGVADVLFGDYKPTGKLAFTWPRSMAQIPINVGDAKYDPLFAFGYGLTY